MANGRGTAISGRLRAARVGERPGPAGAGEHRGTRRRHPARTHRGGLLPARHPAVGGPHRGALGVSRNTLREAFRLLTHERLLVHRLNRGAFVRVLTVGGPRDIYRVRHARRVCGGTRPSAGRPARLTRSRRAVEDGRAGRARQRDWPACGTANIRFHQALTGLAGSERPDDLMRGVLAELRLAFHVMDDPRRFHEPYLTRNREILTALQRATRCRPSGPLGFYLDDSQQASWSRPIRSRRPGSAT